MTITHTSRDTVDFLPLRLFPPYMDWIRLNPFEFLPNGRPNHTLEFRGFIAGKPRRKYQDGYDQGMDIPDYVFNGAELWGTAPNGLLEEFNLRDCTAKELNMILKALKAKTATINRRKERT